MERRKFLVATAAATAGVVAGGLTRGMSAAETTSGSGLLADPAGLRERLTEEARQVFAANLVDSRVGKFHLPSRSSYPRFFAWDSGWNVISQSVFDPEGAVQELTAIFNGLMDETGHVAHEALVPEFDKAKDPTYLWLGDKYFDQQGRCRLIDPPSYLVAAEVLYRRTRDPRVLALLPQMERCLEYLLGPRDLFGDGLVSIIHPWEAGTDLAPVFDEIMGVNVNNPFSFVSLGKKFGRIVSDCAAEDWDLARIAAADEFVFEDLCMNGLALAGAASVAELFAAAGQPEPAAKWKARAKIMAAAMEKIFWDDQRGFFFPRWSMKKRKTAYRVSLPGLIPLISGLVSEDKARRVINEYLTSPKHFWGPWLVPFNSISEMKSENTLFVRGELWRGPCIWINMNFLAAQAAARYGRLDAAREITRNTAVLVGQNGFREYYNPANGKGIGARTFTWPALVLPMIEEFGLE